MSIEIKEPHLTARETASRIGVTVGRIYQISWSGALESVKFGNARLFPLSAVESFQRPKRGRKPKRNPKETATP